MARSDSRDFSLTRNNLIKRAYQVAGIYDLTSAIPNEENEFAVDMLNAMIKHWQAENIYLWNRREATLFTALNTNKYSLGSTGDHATLSYISTQINGALAAGATTVVVDDTTGMTAADNVGIEVTDGTREWTTITSVDSSTQITVPALTGAVADDAYVVSYTNKINRPLLLLNMRWTKLSQLTSEIMAKPFRRDDYFAVSDKTAAGSPNRYYYDKQLDDGVLYVFQRPDDVDYILNFSYYDHVEDMDSATDDFDYPQEFTLALIWNLASELAQAFGMYPELQAIQQKAMMLKMQIGEFNYDEESIFINPVRNNTARNV